MELEAAAVTADFPNHAVALGFGKIIDSLSHVAQVTPRLHLLQADFNGFVDILHQLAILRRDVSDAEHPGGIGIISVQNRGYVHVDDISVLQYYILGRDAVAHLLIDGGTHALRKTFVVQRRRNSAPLGGLVVHPFINFRSADAFPNMFRHIIQHRNVHLRALANSLNFIRCLDNVPAWNHCAHVV